VNKRISCTYWKCW